MNEWKCMANKDNFHTKITLFVIWSKN